MTITAITTSNFEGKINGVTFSHQQLFDTVEYLLNYITQHFSEQLNIKAENIQFETAFVEELMLTIKDIWYKYDSISLGEIESEFRDCISAATNFEELQFDISGETWKIEDLNRELALKNYTFTQ